MLRTFKFLLLVLVAQIISFNSLTSFIFVRASTENYSYLKIVPEPKFLNFTGRWFQFDGFYNFPSFLREVFNVSRGNWKLVNTTLPSSFYKLRENKKWSG
jgi:hypothetical protein